MRPWNDALEKDVPATEVVEIVRTWPGYEDAADTPWKRVRTRQGNKVWAIRCGCGRLVPEPSWDLPTGSPPTLVREVYVVPMLRYPIRLKEHGTCILYMGRCPHCRTFYWDLWPV